MAWPSFRDWSTQLLAASTGWRVPGQGAGCIMIRLKPTRAMASSSYAAGRVLRKCIKPSVHGWSTYHIDYNEELAR